MPSWKERQQAPLDHHLGTQFRRLGNALGLAVALLAPGVAHAADRPSFSFRYELAPGTESCPSLEQLTQTLIEQVGYDPIVGASPGVRSVGLALESDGSNKFVASLKDGETARQFRGDRCEDVISSVVLSLVVSLDPSAKPEPPPPPTVPPAPPVYVPVVVPVYIDRPVPVPAAPTPPQPQPERKLQGVLSASFGLGSGWGPEVSIAPEMSLGLRGAPWEVALGLSYVVPMPVQSENPPYAEVAAASMQTLLLSATGCYAPDINDWLSLFGCATVLLGPSIVDAEFAAVADAGTHLALFVGPRFGLELLVRAPLSLRLTSELLGNLQPTDIYLGGAANEYLYDAPPLASRFSLGASISFR